MTLFLSHVIVVLDTLSNINMATIKQKYQFAVIATDVVIFTIKDGVLSVLLIEMKKDPFKGAWAVPGGLVQPQESVDEAASRHLQKKTGVKDVYLEQLYTFGKVNRDPFGRVVSVAYFALINYQGLRISTTKEYGNIKWFPVNKLPKLAYDHQEIINQSIERLQAKLEYTNIVYSLLPKEFTLSELQNTYEIILNKNLDKRNFRKKIKALKIIKKTGRMQKGSPNRPAELYSFIKRSPQIVQII